MPKHLSYLVLGVVAIIVIAMFVSRLGRRDRIRVYLMGEPVNELEELILDAQKDSSRINEMLEAFKGLKIYALGKTEELVPEGMPQESRTIADFKGWVEGDKILIPVYTSVERLQQSGLESEQYLEMSAGDLLDNLEPNVVVVLNPRFDCEMRLTYDPERRSWNVFRRLIE